VEQKQIVDRQLRLGQLGSTFDINAAVEGIDAAIRAGSSNMPGTFTYTANAMPATYTTASQVLKK